MRNWIPAVALSVLSGCTSLSTRADCRASQRSEVDGDFSAHWVYYRSEIPEAATRATVVIFPPTGGVTQLENWYAKRVCKAGYNAIVVKNWTGDDDLEPDFDRHSRHFARAHRAFEILSAANPGRIRLLGTSLGGLYSLSLMARHDSIERAALITVGAPFTAIVAESGHSELVAVKKKRMKNFSIATEAEYRVRIDGALAHWDDIDKISEFDRPVLMVIGTKDETVPSRYQRDLAKLIKPRQTIEIESGHFLSILTAYFSHVDTVTSFLTAED